MLLLDLYPLKGTFQPGEEVRILVILHSAQAGAATLEISVSHLDRTVAVVHRALSLEEGEQKIVIAYQPVGQTGSGYGVDARLLDASGIEHARRSTAFDVQTIWTDYPRYGFLCDFKPDRQDIDETLDALLRFHINSLQFYDWQYRHHALLSPQDEYIDPLGRLQSLTVVRSLLDAAHQRGMAGMPYLAVYAAGLDFSAAHPGWALYGADGQPLKFFDFLGLMDPTPGRGWSQHLLAECGQVLQALPFDGLHVDQYGDPKEGYDAVKQPVDIPAAFAAFVRNLKASYPQAAVLFNAVGNWPIESLATAPVDSVYIEVWPPAVRYRDLTEIIDQGRAISLGKPVILALYQPAENEASIRLANAFIQAAGATRIALGEQARWLADPYFPKHQPLSDGLYHSLRQESDFAVRYGELLGPRTTQASDVQVIAPEGICSFPHQGAGCLVIGLVNTHGLDDPRWDQAHPAPQPLSNCWIEIHGAPGMHRAWWANPESDTPVLAPIDIQRQGETLILCLPDIHYHSLLVLSQENLEQQDA